MAVDTAKVYAFPFGEHNGETVEQVGIRDHGYFHWFMKTVRTLSPQFMGRMKEVDYRLDNFVPSVTCRAGECGDTAAFLSIVADDSGISVGTDFVYCGEHMDHGSAYHPRSQPYPIRFDAVLNFPHSTDRKQVTDVLLKIAGYDGKRLTKQSAIEFVDNLPLVRPYQSPETPKHAENGIAALQTTLFE